MVDQWQASSYSVEALPSSHGWGGEYDGRGDVVVAKPKNEWLAPSFLLAALVVVSGAYDKLTVYNNSASSDIAVLKVRVDSLKASIDGLQATLRDLERGERVRR